MCETLWVRCNGEELEDWGPFEVLDEVCKTPFRPRASKGMWLRSKMVVCWGLLHSRICKFLWKRTQRVRVHRTFKIAGFSQSGHLVTPILGMCIGLDCRTRMRIQTMKIRSKRVKLPIGPQGTFLTLLLWSLRTLTLPGTRCSCMTWMSNGNVVG